MNAAAARIDRLACAALAREVALEGKPGLVTPTARGSHADMDHRSFTASIAALRGYFGDCVVLGAAGAALPALQARGRVAERAMFAATGGINTHKGAVFTLGLLCAAAGWQLADAGRLAPQVLGEVVAECWGTAILAAGRAPGAEVNATHGARLRRVAGLPGAREQAAAGFPVLFEVTLPQLRAASRAVPPAAAALHALLATMAVLPDTNLAHRGGLAGLAWAQRQAQAFLARGGLAVADGTVALDALCAAFVERWLSPGGSADLLAAAWLLQDMAAQAGRHDAVTDSGRQRVAA
jgi:triphosphoribosyl-dephospho-CoA synthase